MLTIQIPGRESLALNHLVLDYNGTLAYDGRLLPDITNPLKRLSKTMAIHVITADTFGTVKRQLLDIPCKIEVLPENEQDRGKLEYIQLIGKTQVAAIGNGRNDVLMIKAAALGITVIQSEGAWAGTVMAADVVCNSLVSALGLLNHPSRLVATLRC